MDVIMVAPGKKEMTIPSLNPFSVLQGSESCKDQIENTENACAYCSISNPTAVCKCLVCNRWFCNGRQGGSAAHIIHHLVRSGHKEVGLHRDSMVGECSLECFACGEKNVFALGMVYHLEDNSLIVVLCRIVCPQAVLKRGSYSEWRPLIEEKAINYYLANKPTKSEMKKSKKVSLDEMNKAEDLWRKCPNARVDRASASERQSPVRLPVQLVYNKLQEYSSVFEPLVELEAKYDVNLKTSHSFTNLTVKWESRGKTNYTAWITRSSSSERTEVDKLFNLGAVVELIHEYSGFKAVGSITTDLISDKVAVAIDQVVRLTGRKQVKANCITPYSTNFTLKFKPNMVVYERIQKAIRQLNSNSSSASEELKRIILGQQLTLTTKPLTKGQMKRLNSQIYPGLPVVNPSQNAAVKSVLNKPLALVQGPPGTGKTVTAAAIVYALVNVMKKGPILVVAPSNVAVDQLTEKIHSTGLRTVRIAAKCRESVKSSIDYLTIHKQLASPNIFPEYCTLVELKESNNGRLCEDNEDEFCAARIEAESRLLDAAQVVTCTCSGAADVRLKRRQFETVLIDEASQACEPNCLISITKGAKQVIMVGDHCQMGPVVLCKEAAKLGYGQSLFERLAKLGIAPVMLQYQYRMHPCLSEFSSKMFYQGELLDGVLIGDRRELDFPWTDRKNPMMFINCVQSEEISSSGTSYLNRAEADICERIVTRFLMTKDKNQMKGDPPILPSSIGVITPYEGQRVYLKHIMKQNGPLDNDIYQAVEVANVDAFQGREKDYIILSCVRSNSFGDIGFLRDPRRLNVALTRAKYGLIILGNAELLSKFPIWNQLIIHFKNKGLLIDGHF